MAPQYDAVKTQQKTEKESWSVYLAFCNFAFSVYFVFIVLLAGAQDILAGTRIQTSWVLFAAVTPYLFVPLTFPFFAASIPYSYRIITVFLLYMTAFLSLGLVENVYLKLAAVSVASLGDGILDTSAIGLTSYFHPSILSWYGSATGFSFLIGPLYYTAMTTWLCVSPNITLLVLGPCSVLLLISYYSIHKKINSKHVTISEHEIAYTKIATSDDDDEDDITTKTEEPSTSHIMPLKLKNNDQEENGVLDEKEDKTFSKYRLSFWEKLAASKKLLLIVGVPVSIAFASEYVFFQSVITTLAYQNAPFPPRDHYQYYSLALMIGEVLGRCNRSFLEIVKPDWLFTPTRLFMWVLAIIEFGHLILFVCESWYRFLPGVEIPIVLCFTAGVVIGLLYINSLEILRVSCGKREKEFVMTMAILPIILGPFIASLLGLYVEPQLRNHCATVLNNSDYCITRSSDLMKTIQTCNKKLWG